MIRIGTAGWTLPPAFQDFFPEAGTHLRRYAAVFNAAEINQTFRKLPRPSTFARWAESVPEHFRFSVKLPREITHGRRLVDVLGPLRDFLAAVGTLGSRLGPVLIQLPPSARLDEDAARRFLDTLRALRPGPDALEARHESWFTADADRLLTERQVARVAADPPRAGADGHPGGFRGLAYFRLHGQPRTYYSAYREPGDAAALPALAPPSTALESARDDVAISLADWTERLRQAERASGERDPAEVWCIFDNTAAGQAAGDAIRLLQLLESKRR